MKISSVKREDNTMIVSFSGSLDTDTYVSCEEQLKECVERTCKAYIFDMTDLEYISSIGFAVLFRTKKGIEETGGTVVIVNLRPNVKKIFDAVKVLSESLFATLEQADKYLDRYIRFVNEKAKDEEAEDNKE